MTMRRKQRVEWIIAAFLGGLVLLQASPLLAQEVPGGEVVAPLYYAMLLLMLIGYIFFAVALQSIARKTGTPNGWWAWIPVFQIVLSLYIARKPTWWLILCLIPFVNAVMFVLVWMGIAKARNRPAWWGILLLIPGVNLVICGILAWSGGGVNPAAADSGGVAGAR